MSTKAVEAVQSMVNNIRSSAGSKARMDDIVNKLKAVGGMDILTEASGVKVSQPGRRALNEISDGIIDGAATRVAQDAYLNPKSATSRILEATPSARSQMKVALRGEWIVEAVSVTTRSGKEQIRYKVGGKRGVLPDLWRHKVVAETVAAALEQSNGNLSDKRIDRLRDLCAEEEQVLGDIANQKRLLENVSPGNAKRSGAHQVKLDSARDRLRSIRRALGVE